MYVDPQKARQERERQERERQAKIQAEKERKARIKAEEERKAKAERDRKARIKAEEERKAKLKAEQKDPDKKTTQAKKADPKLEAKKPTEPKTEGKKPQAEKKPDDKFQTEITWSKTGQTNPIYGSATPLYGSSAPLYEQPSVPIAKKSEPKPKKPDDRMARTWTGEEPDPVVIAAPHSIHPSVKEQLLATDFDAFKAEQLLKKEQRKQAKQAKLEQAASDQTAPEQNGQTHTKKGDSRFPALLLSDLFASPTLNLNTPEVPMFGGIGSVEPTLVAGPPKYNKGWDFQAITAKPMGNNIDVEVAALQQKYKIKDAQFFRHLVQIRQEQVQKQQSVLELATATGDYKSAASIYGYNGINPGRFSLNNHSQNPQNGKHSYDVSFDLAAAKYYNKIAGVEWVKWNQEKARMEAARLEGERNAREFIATLPNASAQDKEQLARVKQRQTQVKQYSASLRQHLSKHERMAANAPVEKLNFSNQYVVPGSLSHLSQPPQTQTPSQPSNNPFTIPGTQQGEEASQYWANLYVQGERQGGLGGVAKQAVAFPMGMLSSLWTPDTALPTAFTLGTAGLGAAAGAGRLGVASMPVTRGLQIGGAFGSGTSIGQGLSGRNMFTGEELSPLDRGFNLTFGVVGAGFDLGGAGFSLRNLSKGLPTVTRALEGVSAPQVTRVGGRLGLSTEGGSIKLGGGAEEVPKGATGKAKPEVAKPKAQEIKTKDTQAQTHGQGRRFGENETTNSLTNLGKDFSSHNSSVLKDFTPIPNPTRSNQTIFSGVFDPKTNTFLTKPSGSTKLSNGDIPEDLVQPRGGHREIQNILSETNPNIDTSQTVGFTIYYREQGRLDVAFFSRGINLGNFSQLKGYTPGYLQEAAVKLLNQSTGLEIKVIPRLDLPE